jgi:hypothetical protein
MKLNWNSRVWQELAMICRVALRLAIGMCILFAFTAAAQCALIVGYDTSSLTPAVSPGVGATGETLNPVGVAIVTGAAYSTTGWDNGDYLEVGFSASSGTYPFGINLSALQIQYDRNGNGPTDLEIKMQLNGTGPFSSIYTHDLTTESPNFAFSPTINLTSYDHVTSAVFQIFAYNAKNSSGQLDLTNHDWAANGTYAIAITGLAATPEPGSIAVFALGAVAAGYAGWRRRKATPVKNA